MDRLKHRLDAAKEIKRKDVRNQIRRKLRQKRENIEKG